ncbi:ATP synthase F1 subunit epsilon [Candidatus Methylacidithermus pantelleriae]|uniref:ATP synthase epsilon chain n=1 Tax=Candidatus Methylacidithermus pantelleriae TaxID=2744239 RepID=A0A8J2FN83_9BACT|nr:ATP synthase F1 subunit epsilon [Candidatus Methylacidithermus pantelleriae]CAF0689803.1 ATP synthase epsilon chain [Candidatus Methylacidithermus pantelleriae]
MDVIILRVITPEGEIFSGQVSRVSLPGAEGQMEILPGHTALFVKLGPGEVRLQRPKGDFHFLVTGEGFAQITAQEVSLLVDVAVADESLLKEGLALVEQGAIDRLTQLDADNQEITAVQAAIARLAFELRERKTAKRRAGS